MDTQGDEGKVIWLSVAVPWKGEAPGIQSEHNHYCLTPPPAAMVKYRSVCVCVCVSVFVHVCTVCVGCTACVRVSAVRPCVYLCVSVCVRVGVCAC